jgi:hypothetical protein
MTQRGSTNLTWLRAQAMRGLLPQSPSSSTNAPTPTSPTPTTPRSSSGRSPSTPTGSAHRRSKSSSGVPLSPSTPTSSSSGSAGGAKKKLTSSSPQHAATTPRGTAISNRSFASSSSSSSSPLSSSTTSTTNRSAAVHATIASPHRVGSRVIDTSNPIEEVDEDEPVIQLPTRTPITPTSSSASEIPSTEMVGGKRRDSFDESKDSL